MYASEYPPFYVTVDIVVFCVEDGVLKVLAIRRGGEPFRGQWALPGGFVGVDEDLHDAAERELVEETGHRAAARTLTQFGTYGAPGRDPRYLRVVSVAWFTVTPTASAVAGGTDAAHASWEPVADLLAGELAFDHAQILADAVRALADRLRSVEPAAGHRRLAASLLPTDAFRLSELRLAYEAVLGERLDPANFQRRMKGRIVAGTGETVAGERGRPAELFRVLDVGEGAGQEAVEAARGRG